jgi:radical SAM protein with 4Fe4S-binding SPASM domain
MSEKKVTGILILNDNAYERKRLADLLPLDTPLGITFHPSNFCNIKCIFCIHSSANPCYDSIKNKMMDFELFKNAINGIKNFNQKIKSIHFCGIGEPLMNKNIVKMIKYTKDTKVAEKIDLNTNGILLNKENSDALINSEIDFIRISVNGLSKQDFKEYTGAYVDFDKYVENITYLYNNRKNTKIYVKILDFMVETPEKKELFYKIFEPICDSINIENYNERYLDTKGKGKLKDSNLTTTGEVLEVQKCCPQPFFKMEVSPSGNIHPCAEARTPLVSGNIKDDTIVNIWNSKKLNDFRLKMLQGTKFASKICAECTLTKVCSFSSDNIDSEIERLKEYYTTGGSKK